MRPFEIHQPENLEQASLWLDQWGDEAAIYAGGTELLLLLKEGLVHYPHLIDIKPLDGLDGVEVDPDTEMLTIGSLASHHKLERSGLVRKHAAILAEVESQVANVRVRVAGTLGGNLCFAEPHSDPATLLLAWGAELELISASGGRRLPIEAFFLGLFETARRHDEILSTIRVPLLPSNAGAAYEKFAVHERPTATVAAILEMDSGRIGGARLAVGSVGPRPRRVEAAEASLQGQRPSAEAFAEAAAEAAKAVDPVDDLYGSADYKRHLVGVLSGRALTRAAQRTGVGADG